MSYNITSAKIVRMENFIIPLKSLYLSERKDSHPEQPTIIDIEKNLVEIECGCGQTIEGVLKDGELHVTELNISGEGSGSLKYYVLDEAFRQSKGTLVMVLIWEGGDSTSSLRVVDGDLTEGDYSFEEEKPTTTEKMGIVSDETFKIKGIGIRGKIHLTREEFIRILKNDLELLNVTDYSKEEKEGINHYIKRLVERIETIKY